MRVRLRVFLGLLVGIGAVAAGSPVAAADGDVSAVPAIIPATSTIAPPATPPPVTINEFLPEERGLGDCISALPRPGCGSEARGGWRQTLVFLVIIAGLAFIAWRVVAGARSGRSSETPTS